MADDRAIWFENGRHRRKVKRVLKRGHFKQAKEEYHIATTKEELNTQVEEIRGGHNARGVALEGLDNAEKTHEAYLHNRQHGPKRVGRWGQEFASTFADFLSAYSGIIDIVKSAGAPYGEIAYQSLSILLVATQKAYADLDIAPWLDTAAEEMS
ncbi:hypothetical protein CJF30_00004962 [Rutstroemia sp. NJR-2017a BBW]|nr:hypothetical protein CJF30_00004962 [Rutstroemia sp. NJR-2017a BBW]